MIDFKLSHNELHGSLWNKIKTNLQTELQRLRETNDNHQDELQTARVRTRISVIKEILELENQSERELREG